MSAQRPNIILIHGHDIGRYLGTYGRPVDTPNLDRLASEGVRFDNYFCPAPQCSPSRASMMTGLYPHNNGMMGLAHMNWQLDDPRDALPHRLAQAHYTTLLFGEQHEATTAKALGYHSSTATEWPQLAREVATAFADTLPSLPSQQPFFASVGFFEAHRPFDHAGYRNDAPEGIPVPPYLPDDPEVREDFAALHGRIRAVDDGVGIVLSALAAAGLEQNSLVVFTTDHGLAMPRAKGTLYDTGLEAAFICRWPGVPRAGAPSEALLCNIDMAPTLMEAAGAEAQRELDGVSFLPLLRGEKQEVREHFMCQMTWHDQYVPMRGIRTGHWKYIRHFQPQPRLYLPADVEETLSGRAYRRGERAAERSKEELFDLSRDPWELDNLAHEPGHEPTLQELRYRLDEWLGSSPERLSKPMLGNTET